MNYILTYLIIGFVLYFLLYKNLSKKVLDEMIESGDYIYNDAMCTTFLIIGDIVVVLIWPVFVFNQVKSYFN